MRAKQFCILTTAGSRAKILRQLNAFKPPKRLRLLSVLRRGSVVVDLLFNVLPIVCGSWSSVFVFVLLCITLCPF